jgi:hypothetical protein
VENKKKAVIGVFQDQSKRSMSLPVFGLPADQPALNGATVKMDFAFSVKKEPQARRKPHRRKRVSFHLLP